MKKIILVMVGAFMISGCAPRWKTVNLSELDADKLTNLTAVECALGAKIGSGQTHTIYADPAGYCAKSVQGRITSNKISKDELALDLERAKNLIAEQQQQTNLDAAAQRESDRETSNMWNTIAIQNAICASRPWGC